MDKEKRKGKYGSFVHIRDQSELEVFSDILGLKCHRNNKGWQRTTVFLYYNPSIYEVETPEKICKPPFLMDKSRKIIDEFPGPAGWSICITSTFSARFNNWINEVSVGGEN